MTSCTIIVSHFEACNFVHAAIKQIRKYAHPEIRQHIIIAEQSGDETHNGIAKQYGNDEDITVVKTKSLYSGYGIDFIIRNIDIDTDFICQIHCDVLPISKQWLYLPIKLIEEKKFSFVGQLQFIADGKASIYPPKPFFAMAQCFNVARIETYNELSFFGGFTRFHERNKVKNEMTWLNDDWKKWAKEDYNNRGSDDDVVAFCWEDAHRQHDKLGLAITGYIEPAFGRIIDSLVFHFGSCVESRGVINSMSDGYRKYIGRINNGYTDELIEEMVSLAKANQPPQMEILRRNHWNGKTKMSSPPSEELNKRIEELKTNVHDIHCDHLY